MSEIKLPELPTTPFVQQAVPKPKVTMPMAVGIAEPIYTASQLQTYARAAVELDRASRPAGEIVVTRAGSSDGPIVAVTRQDEDGRILSVIAEAEYRPAGEAVAWLHDVVQSDGEQDQALSFSPDSFPLKGVGGFESIKSTPLFLAPQATHNKCDADFVALQIARRFVPYLEPQRRAQLQVAIRDAICKATPPPAVSVPLCVCCGQPADGETACELHTGQWTCSSDCWDKAARMYDESPAASEVAAMDAVVAAYNSWPADIRKKLSLHDLRRMTGWTPLGAAPAVSEDVRELLKRCDAHLTELRCEYVQARDGVKGYERREQQFTDLIAEVDADRAAIAKFAHVQGEAASDGTRC